MEYSVFWLFLGCVLTQIGYGLVFLGLILRMALIPIITDLSHFFLTALPVLKREKGFPR